MVPARRQETPAATDAAVHTGGFAKVLTSIQGLQQRLDGFSVDEANQAAANVHTLIAQLTLLQSKLDRIAELKQFVSASNSLIGKIPEQNFDRVDFDSFASHPQLSAIIKASKLIQIHKLMKSAKADAESLTMDSELGQLEFTTLSSGEESAGAVQTVSASEAGLTSEAIGATATTNETEVPDRTAVTLDSASGTIRGEGWFFSVDAELDKTEPQFVETAVPSLHRTQHQSNQDNIAKPGPMFGDTKTPAAAIGFDQRFLRDLIEAYGELSPASQSSVPIALSAKLTSTNAGNDSLPNLSKADDIEKRSELYLVPQDLEKHSALPVQAVASNSTSFNLPALQEINLPVAPTQSMGPLVPVSDIALRSNTAIDQAPAARGKVSVPNVTNNGELDQQLKRIIKDYGEYDLYSQQSSTNLKKAAIAAFALLGLVLGGLYFFKATAPSLSSPARANAPASPTLNPNHSEAKYQGEAGAKSQSESKP